MINYDYIFNLSSGVTCNWCIQLDAPHSLIGHMTVMCADFSGSEPDTALMEEREALNIQRKMAEQLRDEDFGLDIFKASSGSLSAVSISCFYCNKAVALSVVCLFEHCSTIIVIVSLGIPLSRVSIGTSLVPLLRSYRNK